MPVLILILCPQTKQKLAHQNHKMDEKDRLWLLKQLTNIDTSIKDVKTAMKMLFMPKSNNDKQYLNYTLRETQH